MPRALSIGCLNLKVYTINKKNINDLNRNKLNQGGIASLFYCPTPPHHLIYIYIFNFIYTSPPIFISPFFFLNFFCPVVIIQQMMPRVQPILKPRTSPFIRAYGGIASFFFGKIFYETL